MADKKKKQEKDLDAWMREQSLKHYNSPQQRQKREDEYDEVFGDINDPFDDPKNNPHKPRLADDYEAKRQEKLKKKK